MVEYIFLIKCHHNIITKKALGHIILMCLYIVLYTLIFNIYVHVQDCIFNGYTKYIWIYILPKKKSTRQWQENRTCLGHAGLPMLFDCLV